MNIIIFGSNCNIGIEITKELLEDQTNNILCVDNIYNNNDRNLVLSFTDNDRYSFFNGNILNNGFMEVKLDIIIKDIFSGIVDIIYNCSTLHNTEIDLKFLDICTIGTKNICYLTDKYNSKLLHISPNISPNIKDINTYNSGNIIAHYYIFEYSNYVKNILNKKFNYKIIVNN